MRIALCLAVFATSAVGANGVIDGSALGNEADGRNWATVGRTYAESHYSPLVEINRETVARLNLGWTLDLDVTDAISTPLAVDGVLYVAAGYGIVQAVDAKTGRSLWRYDPEVTKVAGRKLRAAGGVRGPAYWKGRLFVGTQDGRLVAIDAKKGTPVWSVQTIDAGDDSFVAGPPRVFDDKVLIGSDSGDVGPVRGYVTAYDAETGKQRWRWWTVPGDPSKGFENEAMERAAKTWTGEWWKYGGGGAVGGALTFDPELERVYVGTGGGAPANWKIRSPGGGDNLFLSSVVALDAETGEYVWHYQATPADAWGYDSATEMTLATLTVAGAARKVILHAAENGFFYVIDRANGRLISAEKLGKVTWAERVDPATGRPLVAAGARYENGAVTLWPGVHAHFPHAFSPKSGLVYVPTSELSAKFGGDVDPRSWQPLPSSMQFSGFPTTDADLPADAGRSFLVAWDPGKQRANWQQPTPGPLNGGALATAGDLVFQGQADGYVMAYDANSGKRVWQFYAAIAALGTPITYQAGAKQQLTILTGPMTGAAAATGQGAAQFGWDPRIHPRRLVTFVLDGKAKLPATPPPTFAAPLDGTAMEVDRALAEEGMRQWSRCQQCHGPGAIAGGAAPDLRASQVPLDAATFAGAVRTGNPARGMPTFDELTDRELEALRHYVRARARLVTRPNGAAPPPPAPPPSTPEKKEPAGEQARPPGSLESTTPRQ